MSGSLLLIVDVQERLFRAMESEGCDEVLRNVKTLGFSARRLGIPLVVTEQYPRGLGHTVPELCTELPDVRPIEKTAFSCRGADGFVDHLRGDTDVFREISKLLR